MNIEDELSLEGTLPFYFFNNYIMQLLKLKEKVYNKSRTECLREESVRIYEKHRPLTDQ